MATRTPGNNAPTSPEFSRSPGAFDLYIAQQQIKSKLSSSIALELGISSPSSSFSQELQTPSLLPPPRPRKPKTTSSESSSNMQADTAVAYPLGGRLSVGSLRYESDSSQQSYRRPSAPAAYFQGTQGTLYAKNMNGSLSSLSSFSNLFYQPSPAPHRNSLIATPVTPAKINTDVTSALEQEALVDDYSELLYPDLSTPSSAHSSRSNLINNVRPVSLTIPSAVVKRKPIPAFEEAPGNAPESPVEFSNIIANPSNNASSTTVALPPRPSAKAERILGMSSASPSRQSSRRSSGSSQQFARISRDPERGPHDNNAVRESFIDLSNSEAETPATPASNKPGGSPFSFTSELPTFTKRRAESINGSHNNTTLGDYKALLGVVEAKRGSATSTDVDDHHSDSEDSLQEKRKVLVDGSDIKKKKTIPGMPVKPSTSNVLDHRERSDLIRQNRKIAQMLGPGAFVKSKVIGRIRGNSDSILKKKHDGGHRSVQSAGPIPVTEIDGIPRSSWEVLNRETIYMNATGRRHSSPLSSSIYEYKDDEDGDADLKSLADSLMSDSGSGDQKHETRSASPTSFMELSDEEGMRTPRRSRSADILNEEQERDPPNSSKFYELDTPSPNAMNGSYSSFQDSMNSKLSEEEDEWKAERRQKRAKLAKIHRYLGSKVPAELVLGYSSSTIPPAAPQRESPDHGKARKSRARSASTNDQYGSESSHMSSESRNLDTMKEKERMLQIRRTAKIEQILGETSQTLYRSQPNTPNPSRPSTAQRVPTDPSANLPKANAESIWGFKHRPSLTNLRSFGEGRPSTSGSSRPSTAHSATGLMFAYQKEVEHVQNHSTQDRSKILSAVFPVGTALGSPAEDEYVVLEASPLPSASRHFLDYQKSINSLNRMIDSDDHESLSELHRVINSDEEEGGDTVENIGRLFLTKLNMQSDSTHTPETHLKSLSRRSSIGSIKSVETVSSIATLTPEPMTFQARRKRAAKLTHFFGASYRDLFGEVLNRIERGVLEEATAGEMSREEMQDLMNQLNSLKSRNSLAG